MDKNTFESTRKLAGFNKLLRDQPKAAIIYLLVLIAIYGSLVSITAYLLAPVLGISVIKTALLLWLIRYIMT